MTRFNGKQVHVTNIYNKSTDSNRKYHPYTDDNFENYHMTYSRDKFGRLQKVSSNLKTDRTDSYIYTNNSVTYSNDGITRTKTYDDAGRLIRSNDHKGDLTYHLRADGQPDKIIVTSGNTLSFTYDSYGRQISVNDLSLGLTTFTYDK